MSIPPLADLPVLGVCGPSGAGKVELLERVLPALTGRGLTVAVEQDREQEGPPGAAQPARLAALCRDHDLVLVVGAEHPGMSRVWLAATEGPGLPPEGGEVLAVLGSGEDRAARLLDIVEEWLPRRWVKPPVYGCVLIGGQSRRMGRPKHLIAGPDGRTWLERTVALLGRVAERVVIAGAGEVPDALADTPRLPDRPGVAGPMAGMLAAMEWAPHASWLMTACDLPDLSEAALAWLIGQRRPGVWAVLPRRAGGAGVEPLLGHYDPRAATLLAALAGAGRLAPRELAGHPKVCTPPVPEALAPAWRNVNTPEELGGSPPSSG